MAFLYVPFTGNGARRLRSQAIENNSEQQRENNNKCITKKYKRYAQQNYPNNHK